MKSPNYHKYKNKQKHLNSFRSRSASSIHSLFQATGLMGDNNIQRPTHVRPCMPPSNWRSRLDPRARQKVIAKIIEILRRQSIQPEELAHVEKVARSFEDKVFAVALDQHDYLKRISYKMKAMEEKAQRGVANSSMPYPTSCVPNHLDPATSNVQSQDSNHSQMPLQIISPPQPQPQPHQIIASKTPSSNFGFSSASSSVPAVNKAIHAPGSNFACQSSNISNIPSSFKRNSSNQCVSSNPMTISRTQEQQRQHIQPQLHKNYEKQFLEEQQARNQLPNQNTSHGNVALTLRKNCEQSVSRLSQPVSTQQHGSYQDVPVQGKVAALQLKATSQQSFCSSPMNRQSQFNSSQKHFLQPNRNQSINPQRPGAPSIAHEQKIQNQHVNIGAQKTPNGSSSSQWVESQEKIISPAVKEKKKPSPYASSQPHSLLRPVGRIGQSGTLSSLEVSNTSEAPSYGEKHASVEAWRENTYNRIITMRGKYMSRLEELRYMIKAKLKQLISSQEDHSNNRQFESAKENDKMVERSLRLLNIPKDKLVPRHEECLDDWEDKIVSYLSKFDKARNTSTSVQQEKQFTNQHVIVKTEEKQQASLPLVISPGISPSSLLSKCDTEENNVVAQTPIQRLVNCLSTISHSALKSAVDDMYSVVCLVDGLEASEPTPGSRSSLGQDLAETTRCRRQEARRHISLDPRETWNGLENPRKIQRIEAYSYSNNLREEIEDVNQKLIDTQVNICDEQHASSGIVIKCLFNGISVNPLLFKVQPLHLLVPTDYPKCSPILLDELSGEIGDDFLDISTKARLKLGAFLQDLKNPVTVSEIARTWEVCAREVIIELAEKYGGGTFSSRYGTWENCLESTV